MTVPCPQCSGTGTILDGRWECLACEMRGPCCEEHAEEGDCYECEGTGTVNPGCSGCGDPIEGAAFIVDLTEIYHDPACLGAVHPSVLAEHDHHARDCNKDHGDIP